MEENHSEIPKPEPSQEPGPNNITPNTSNDPGASKPQEANQIPDVSSIYPPIPGPSPYQGHGAPQAVTMNPGANAPTIPNQPIASSPQSDGSPDYISNPYLNTARGLVEILQTNPDTTMLATLTLLIPLILIYIWLFLSAFLGALSKSPALLIIGGVTSFIAIIIYGLLVSGVMSAVASESINREHTTVGHVWHMAFSKLLPLLGLSIVYGFITLIAYALLIVPGLIFTSRASLAFLLVFEEDLGPIAALKRSFELTRYHAFEMLASIFSSYLMTGGYLLLTTTAVSPFVGRYEDFKKALDSGQPKQEVHWLNYLTSIIGSLYVTMFIGIYVVILIIGIVAKNQSTTTTTMSHGNSYNYQSALIDPNTGAVNEAMSSALNVGNDYLQDLTGGNWQAAYALETSGPKSLQSVTSTQILANTYKQWGIAGDSSKLTDIAYVKGFSGEPAVSLLYTYDLPNGNPFYVRLVAEYLNNAWAIDLAQGSSVKVFP